MKIIRTEITPFTNNPLHMDISEYAYLSSPYHLHPSYHKHPELQLTLILKGYGKRVIGNEIADFKSGDMVFVGSNVPHVWLSDPVFFQKDSKLKSKAITVYIDPKVFQQMFDSVKEMDGIKMMIQQAAKGINIFGRTRNIIADKLIKLSSKTGFEKVMGLLQIMNLISLSPDKKLIINQKVDLEEGQYPDRLVAVLRYIKRNLHEQISLDQVAEVACMTKPSFCRFFKNRTKKKFSQYLVELRVEHACELLITGDKSISHIANLCGYNSDSHFCKVFKDQIGQSPFQYRRRIGIPGR